MKFQQQIEKIITPASIHATGLIKLQTFSRMQMLLKPKQARLIYTLCCDMNFLHNGYQHKLWQKDSELMAEVSCKNPEFKR